MRSMRVYRQKHDKCGRPARPPCHREPDFLTSVTVEDVRDVGNISSADIADTKILKMLKRAEVTLELELGKEIDCQNCTDAEKEFKISYYK